MKMTRDAYVKMVAENRQWLAKQPRTLERDHIDLILQRSPFDHYDNERELERLRAELEQVRLTVDEQRDGIRALTASLDSAREDNAALEAKLKAAAAAHPGCGLLDDLAGECQCAKREQHLRADNARLREAGEKLAEEVRSENGDYHWERLDEFDAALASTDPSPWLREFGMKVATAVDVRWRTSKSGAPSTNELVAIVDGVMK